MTSTRSNTPIVPDRSQRGAALVFTIIGLAVITVMGLAITALGMASTSMAVQEGQTREALSVADAGIEHGKRLLLWQEWASLNQFLQRGDATGCSWDEFEGVPGGTLPVGYPVATPDFVPAAGRAFGGGSYMVSLCDNHTKESTDPIPDVDPNSDADKSALLRSVGVMANGSRAAIEVVLAARDLPAIIVNGSLEVKGNPTVTGPAGSIHSNGMLDLSGNPCTHEYYSSTDEVTPSGNVQGGATCTAAGVDARPYSPPLNIPMLNPADYIALADYRLVTFGNTGRILDSTGSQIGTAPWNGWSYNHNPARTWSFNGTIPGGTYYVQGNVGVTGNPAAADGSALPLSLFIEGSFTANGNPLLTPDTTVPGLGAIMVIAGTDISLGATVNNTYTGLFYARDQLDVAGTPTINGQMIAANDPDDPYPGPQNTTNHNPVKLNSSGYMELSGNPIVNYTGSGVQSIQPISWRECRGDWVGAGPGSPCGPP